MEKLVFNEATPEKTYQELFKQGVGYIFKVEDDYETVMCRIEDYKPAEGEFEVFPVNPGTDTYSLVGPNHCVIVKNTLNVTD